jgi:hypothetical protein
LLEVVEASIANVGPIKKASIRLISLIMVAWSLYGLTVSR